MMRMYFIMESALCQTRRGAVGAVLSRMPSVSWLSPWNALSCWPDPESCSWMRQGYLAPGAEPLCARLGRTLGLSALYFMHIALVRTGVRVVWSLFLPSCFSCLNMGCLVGELLVGWPCEMLWSAVCRSWAVSYCFSICSLVLRGLVFPSPFPVQLLYMSIFLPSKNS